MNVVRPHVQSVQLPVPVRADFSNRVVGDKATLVIELHRRMLEAMGFRRAASRIRIERWRTRHIVFAIHRARIIAVKP